jgi:hypothetical protein
LKKILTALTTALGRAMFWRKHPPTSEESAAEDLAQTMPPPEPTPVDAAEPATDAEAGEAKPSRISTLVARLAFWRRTAKNDADTADEAAAPDNAPPSARSRLDAPPPDEEAPSRPPLAKRALTFLMKKKVWMPATAVLLVALTATGSISYMQAQRSSQDKALQQLQMAKLQLEEENKKLRAQPTMIPAPNKPNSRPEAAAKPSVDPAFDIPQSEQSLKASAAARENGDCVVTDKETVGQSLKRCIESFNQASTSGTKKPRTAGMP